MKKFIDICQFLLVLMGLMVCGLFFTSLTSLLPLGGTSTPAQQWALFAGQNILAFILPALLTWHICFKVNPVKAIGGASAPSAKMIGIALAIYIIGIPALNQIVYWNQEMHLPEFLDSFQKWCEAMESVAEQQLEGIMNSTALFPTAMNILIIGGLTGIGEEFFFRGAMQGMLIRCRVNPHVAIWTVAFIFSAIHFQFFGFVPRMLLGAFFGYLFWWSGNIWVNSFAHALNNSLVIISNWFINKDILKEEFDMFGVSYDGFPLWGCVSAIAVFILIFVLYKRGFLTPSCNFNSDITAKSTDYAAESK